MFKGNKSSSCTVLQTNLSNTGDVQEMRGKKKFTWKSGSIVRIIVCLLMAVVSSIALVLGIVSYINAMDAQSELDTLRHDLTEMKGMFGMSVLNVTHSIGLM